MRLKKFAKKSSKCLESEDLYASFFYHVYNI